MVYRDRIGVSACYKILKYQKNNPKLLLRALEALDRIGFKRWSKSLDSSLVREVTLIINSTKDVEIQNAAAKVLWTLSENPEDENLKGLFLQQLEQLDISDQQHKTYALSLIRLLGNFQDSDSSMSQKSRSLLSKLLTSSGSDIAFTACIALTNTHDREALLACLKVIQGPLWDRYKDFDELHTNDALGHYLLIRHRPDSLHDNRQALRTRILNRLVDIELKEDPQFSNVINEELEKYVLKPTLFPRGS